MYESCFGKQSVFVYGTTAWASNFPSWHRLLLLRAWHLYFHLEVFIIIQFCIYNVLESSSTRPLPHLTFSCCILTWGSRRHFVDLLPGGLAGRGHLRSHTQPPPRECSGKLHFNECEQPNKDMNAGLDWLEKFSTTVNLSHSNVLVFLSLLSSFLFAGVCPLTAT